MTLNKREFPTEKSLPNFRYCHKTEKSERFAVISCFLSRYLAVQFIMYK